MMDGYVITSGFSETNPIVGHGFAHFAGNGLTRSRPSTSVSNGFNPNVYVALGLNASRFNPSYMFNKKLNYITRMFHRIDSKISQSQNY